jgi:hypothetical protein
MAATILRLWAKGTQGVHTGDFWRDDEQYKTTV